MRVLYGYDNGKPCATITSSKEEIDSQFWHPRRNKVIKDYKNIKDNYSWFSEDDSEFVNEEPTKNSPSPKIYDLRTPLKSSKRMDTTEIVLSSESSTKINKKAKGFEKSDKVHITSNWDTTSIVQGLKTIHSQELSLVDLILMEENSRSKCSKVGESHCYKTFQ